MIPNDWFCLSYIWMLMYLFRRREYSIMVSLIWTTNSLQTILIPSKQSANYLPWTSSLTSDLCPTSLLTESSSTWISHWRMFRSLLPEDNMCELQANAPTLMRWPSIVRTFLHLVASQICESIINEVNIHCFLQGWGKSSNHSRTKLVLVIHAHYLSSRGIAKFIYAQNCTLVSV